MAVSLRSTALCTCLKINRNVNLCLVSCCSTSIPSSTSYLSVDEIAFILRFSHFINSLLHIRILHVRKVSQFIFLFLPISEIRKSVARDVSEVISVWFPDINNNLLFLLVFCNSG